MQRTLISQRMAFTISMQLIALVACCSIASFGKTSSELNVKRVEVKLLDVSVNPEDPGDLWVSVAVTVLSADQALVVPTCSELSGVEGFCSVQLARADGKGIGVRKGLAASLGIASLDQWKPVVIAPNTSKSFRFGFSTRLLDVRCGEQIRVKFQAWRNADSFSDWNASTTFMTPIFLCPTNSN